MWQRHVARFGPKSWPFKECDNVMFDVLGQRSDLLRYCVTRDSTEWTLKKDLFSTSVTWQGHLSSVTVTDYCSACGRRSLSIYPVNGSMLVNSTVATGWRNRYHGQNKHTGCYMLPWYAHHCFLHARLNVPGGVVLATISVRSPWKLFVFCI